MSGEKQILYIDWKNKDASFQIKHKWQKSNCTHARAELDETTRTVFCAECGDQIDAFDFLMTMAFKESRQLERLAYLTRECQKLESKLKKLKNK